MRKTILAFTFIALMSCNGDLECDVERLKIIETYDSKIEKAGNDTELIRLLRLEKDIKIEELDC